MFQSTPHVKIKVVTLVFDTHVEVFEAPYPHVVSVDLSGDVVRGLIAGNCGLQKSFIFIELTVDRRLLLWSSGLVFAITKTF
jgi:hypothetical protein